MRKPVFGVSDQVPHKQKKARDLKFGFRKKRDCTIRVAKTEALISLAVTAKLICILVFSYAKIRFSHDAAHFKSQRGLPIEKNVQKMQMESQTVKTMIRLLL